jgi:hypothetical protein
MHQYAIISIGTLLTLLCKDLGNQHDVIVKWKKCFVPMIELSRNTKYVGESSNDYQSVRRPCPNRALKQRGFAALLSLVTRTVSSAVQQRYHQATWIDIYNNDKYTTQYIDNKKANSPATVSQINR